MRDGGDPGAENHPAVADGRFAPASRTVRMPLREAAALMMRNTGGEGGAYVQAELSEALAREAGLADPSDDADPSMHEPWRSMHDAGWTETQPARMWLSAGGAVSPLHFDASASVLAQVEGCKRMLLYPPSALSRAHLYPNWHPLRRRARVRLDAQMSDREAAEAYPRWFPAEDRRPPGAWEAVLGPGDVLVFPPRWAHYTESLGPAVSVSVTRRFRVPRRDPNRPNRPNDPPSLLGSPDGVTPASLESAMRFARWAERRGAVARPRRDAAAGSRPDDEPEPAEAGEEAAGGEKRGAGLSDGARCIAQLEAARVVHPVGRPLRLNEAGEVEAEHCASGRECSLRRRTGGGSGRGAVGMWLTQWWAAAEDAAALALETFDREVEQPADELEEAEEKMESEEVVVEEEDVDEEGVLPVTLRMAVNAKEDGVKVQLVASREHSGEIAERSGEIAERSGSPGGRGSGSWYSRVVGVYARGSVARGEARVGVSDVDVVVVVWGDAADAAKLAEDEARLRSKLSSDAHWKGRWGHLATKADVRVVTVPPPPHPAGAALAGAIAGDPLARQDPGRTRALLECLGDEGAFVLAVESATVYGPDLPLLLPRAARVPRPRCLPTLRADVTDALADGGERALRWALKRSVRAAFEQAAANEEGAGSNPDRGGERCFTRDLFHCASLAADGRPELGEDLATALVAAVHGPRAVWGALWWACGSALCVRLRDAVSP